jgi:hypothetical protein
MPSSSTRLLLAWLLCATAATLFPFEFHAASPAGAQGIAAFDAESHQHQAAHVVLNVLLFLPLGALVDYKARARLGSGTVVVASVVAGLLLSWAIESVQRFLPHRDASFVDVTANTAGALVGAFGGRVWTSSAVRRVHELRTATSPAALALVLFASVALTLVLSAALQSRARLSNWAPEFPLTIGNEPTGDRPWRGRVFSLSVTDTAAPASLVRRFSAGEPVVPEGSRLAVFDLAGEPPYRDEAGIVPDLRWAGAGDRGASSGGAWLRSDGPPSRLVQRLRQTNAFTLLVRCATDDVGQDGPARIITNSAQSSSANFMVGQQGADLVVRLRTPQTAPNGHALETIVPAVFSSGVTRDILVTYDGANLVTAVAADRAYRSEFTPGSAVAVALMPLNARADQLPTYKLAYLAALFLPAGVAIGLLGRTRRDRILFSAVYLLAAAPLVEATLVLVSGRGLEWGNIALAAGAGAAVLALVGIVLYQPDLPVVARGRRLQTAS